jgi:DNA polymerase-3 subunit gamma/tau
VLRDFLADLCGREGITVDPLVLPLVVRAGAGSARDALSVLDQLAAGAGDDGISYDRALSILGYTDAALLDETVDAFAAGDGAAVFATVDRVIEAGIDPRRFAQDLLERFRDLLVIDAVPDAGDSGLLDLPADELERMRGQAARFGRASLSRGGDVMAQALVDMRGTTSPRLVLELACVRVLLPGAASDTAALLARLDRLERRLSVTADGAVAPTPPQPAAGPAGQAADAAPQPPVDGVPPAAAADEAPPDAAAEPAAAPPPTAATPTAPAPGGGVLDVSALRRLWDDVLDAVKQRNRSAHAMLKEYAQVADVDARAVTLAFNNVAIGRQFEAKAEFFRDALREVAGADLQVRVASTATPRPKPDTAPAAAPVTDVVDVSDADIDADASEDDEPVDAVSLLQQGLGAHVIGEIEG